MPIHSSNPLGSDDASFEYGVCLCVLRKRVRYWASLLPELNREECNFLGALVALRTMCDHAPMVVRGHIFDSEIDEWQEGFETWVDRCKKKIEKRNVSVDELKSKAAEEFERLKAVSEDRPKAMWLSDVKADLASIETRPL